MGEIKEVMLVEEVLQAISIHAVETFPEECCGIILNDGESDQLRRCTNIQNQLHARDPETYPRDATIAYTIDPKELASTLGEVDSGKAKIKAFYHSHPGHDAYFSQEDKALAAPFGEPSYPESAQIVISIYDRVVKRIATYGWSEEKRDFIEIPLKPSHE